MPLFRGGVACHFGKGAMATCHVVDRRNAFSRQLIDPKQNGTCVADAIGRIDEKNRLSDDILTDASMLAVPVPGFTQMYLGAAKKKNRSGDENCMCYIAGTGRNRSPAH